MLLKASPKKIIRFGEFEVDLQAGQLFKGGARVKLGEQALEVLAILPFSELSNRLSRFKKLVR